MTPARLGADASGTRLVRHAQASADFASSVRSNWRSRLPVLGWLRRFTTPIENSLEPQADIHRGGAPEPRWALHCIWLSSPRQIESLAVWGGAGVAPARHDPAVDGETGMANVKFDACGNTIAGMTKKEGKNPPIIEKCDDRTSRRRHLDGVA